MSIVELPARWEPDGGRAIAPEEWARYERYMAEIFAAFGMGPVYLAITGFYMLGFLPGLAYLGDVPPELVVPRLQTPRQAAGIVKADIAP